MKACIKCVLPETYPGISFNDEGVCNFCLEYAAKDEREKAANLHFTSEAEVKECMKKFKELNNKYDLLVPISGGVDSCFTLIQIVENYKLNPLVFHSDHGWDDPTATRNVEKLCRELDVDMIIWKNDLKFMRKLFKYFNESDEKDISPCFVCGNMLYLNGLELADYFKVPLVINGYSKGQAAMMHDKETARELYAKMIEVILETGDQEFFTKFTKKWALLDKQVIYQNKHDLEKEVNLEKILFVPFFVFKFYKTDKEKLKKICQDRFDWEPIKTSYPSRTTNCEMIWLNSYLDLKKRGYTLYHDEYSTLIRAGEFTREQALKDLDMNPPDGLLERLASEVGLEIDLD